MRILLLSDIHANYAAIQALENSGEKYDVLICLGDIVDYGLEPVESITWVRNKANYVVRGNHDHGVAQKVMIQGIEGFRYLTGITRQLTIPMIGNEERNYLNCLPTTLWANLGGKRFLFCHATPRDPMDEYAPPEIEFWKRRLPLFAPDYICVGHTHHQYILNVGQTTIINPGSLGLPRDGDARAGYVILDDNKAEMKRIEYDIDSTIKKLRSSSLPEGAKEMLEEVYRTGKLTKRTP